MIKLRTSGERVFALPAPAARSSVRHQIPSKFTRHLVAATRGHSFYPEPRAVGASETRTATIAQ